MNNFGAGTLLAVAVFGVLSLILLRWRRAASSNADEEFPILLDTVILIVDPAFGESITPLIGSHPIWAVDTPANAIALAQYARGRRRKLAGTNVTTFKYDESAGPSDWCENILRTIEEHHAYYAQDPVYSHLNVIGTALTDEIQYVLECFGFCYFTSCPNGFEAAKPATGYRVTIGQAIDILERVANGEMPPDVGLAQWPETQTRIHLLDASWHHLSHFANDSDIRAKDASYADYQIQTLRDDAENLKMAFNFEIPSSIHNK